VDAHWDATVNGSLASSDLSLTGLDGLSHEDSFDEGGVNASALHGGGNGVTTEVLGAERSEYARKFSYWGTGSGDDNGA
jgi:hypothetical protein